ncbi:hypothetical protein D3C87_1353110 [compost metagenome]
MNAKKAKQLRQLARKAYPANNINYATTEHRERLVKTGGLNADGTSQLRVVKPITITIQTNCARGIYRAMKKINK